MTLHLTNPARRLIITLLAVFSIVATALPTAFLTPAFGDHFNDSESLQGGFEIDGDFAPGTPALTPPGGKDWTNIGVVTAADDLDAPNDDLIDGKENDPSAWTFHTGTSNPAKNDILRTFFASDTHDERPFVYLGYEYFDAPGQGASTINFELNQNTTTGGAIVAREVGDLLITYDYPGGEAPVKIETFKWNGSAWIASTGEIVAGDVNGEDRAWPDVAPFNTTSESTTVKAQHFGEVAVDLKSVVGDDCITVGSAWSKTRTSGSNPLTSELTDYIKPINVPPINTCGSIEVHKEDENRNLLDGATFELWMDDDSSGTLDSNDILVDTCVTGETGQDTGTCLWDDLEPGTYWVIETDAPDWYRMASTAVSIPPHPDDLDETARTGVVHPVTLASLQDYVVDPGTFVNPRIPFKVTVEPQDTNLIGQSHEFLVTLWADMNGVTTDGPDDDGFETAVGGEDLDLDWSGPTNSSIVQIVDDNGTASGLDTIDTSCTTRDTDAGTDDADTSSMDEGTENETGTCVVTVNSTTDGGVGTLTATYSPSYQHYTSADDVTGSNTKTWLGYSAEVEDDGVNLSGDESTPGYDASDSEHTFTITSYESDGTGDPDATAKGGIQVGFVWTGTGSVVRIVDASGNDDSPTATDGVYTCDTKTDGTCDVVVDSNAVGTGEIIIAHVDAGTNVSGTSLIDYDMDGDAADETDTGDVLAGDAQRAQKDWVTYDAVVDDSATNLAGEPHDFTITAHKYDGDGDPDAAKAGGVTVGFTWTGDGSVTAGATFNETTSAWECTTAASGTDEGTCTVTVDLDGVGQGTLTTVYVNPGDIGGPDTGDDVVTLDTNGTSTHIHDGDNATKTWIDFNVVVGPDAENLVGEDHTFYIEVTSTDESIDLNGHTVNYTWLAPDAAEAVADACTTEALELPGDEEATDGTCAVTVSSEVTGQGTITISSLVLTEGTVEGNDSTVEFDVTGETGPAADTATKTWIDYQVSVSPETDENLTGSNHVFTVLVERDSGDGEGFQPLADAKPSLEITDGPGDILTPANLCASVGTDTNGECTVTITSSETGTTTVRASYLGDAADSEAQTFTSDPATKKWVDYLIDVDPDRAVNPVGTTHTFTVTLQRIEDGVAAAAADEPVALSITGPGDIIEVPAGTIDGDARSGSCTTDAAGQCDVTIASDEVGDTTLTATYDAVVGESTGTFSDSGLKLWRSDPAIELVKNADIEPTADGLKIINCNEGGCPETEFTFTVTNVGGVHLHDVTVTDDKFGPITLQDDELTVGESTTGTATYTPTREEIDAGLHENLGTATGVSPDGQTVRDTDPERVEIIEVLPNVIERPEPPPAPAPEPAPLPRTGADAAWMSLTALLALLLGWSMVWLGRRREIEDQA